MPEEFPDDPTVETATTKRAGVTVPAWAIAAVGLLIGVGGPLAGILTYGYRIEKLEEQVAEHEEELQAVAGGLAEMTWTVRAIRHDLTQTSPR